MSRRPRRFLVLPSCTRHRPRCRVKLNEIGSDAIRNLVAKRRRRRRRRRRTTTYDCVRRGRTCDSPRCTTSTHGLRRTTTDARRRKTHTTVYDVVNDVLTTTCDSPRCTTSTHGLRRTATDARRRTTTYDLRRPTPVVASLRQRVASLRLNVPVVLDHDTHGGTLEHTCFAVRSSVQHGLSSLD